MPYCLEEEGGGLYVLCLGLEQKSPLPLSSVFHQQECADLAFSCQVKESVAAVHRLSPPVLTIGFGGWAWPPASLQQAARVSKVFHAFLKEKGVFVSALQEERDGEFCDASVSVGGIKATPNLPSQPNDFG